MRPIKSTLAALGLAAACCHLACAADDTAPAEAHGCEKPTPQAIDAGVVQTLERDWLAAEYRGDVHFLDCLLAPGYQVIVARDHTVKSKADLLARVAGRRGRQAVPPPIHTMVVLNGRVATAYSWVTDQNDVTVARYVDFYEFRDGRWTAVSGVDL